MFFKILTSQLFAFFSQNFFNFKFFIVFSFRGQKTTARV